MSAKSQWTRAKIEASCGACGKRIYIQQPMLAIKFEHVKRQLVRCVECVGPAPPDLPEVVVIKEPERAPLRPLRTTANQFTRAKLSDQDWTARILGEKNS